MIQRYRSVLKMKFANLLVGFLLPCVLASVNATFVFAQEKQDEVVKNITNYINKSEELGNYSTNGYTAAFTGNFLAISDELGIELEANFPEHRFYIAKMKVSIDPPIRDGNLILFTSAETADVEGFFWSDFWMIRPSDSFEKILQWH